MLLSIHFLEGRSFTWNVENQPTNVSTTGGVNESYAYDADGERILRTSGTPSTTTTTTYYIGGLYEEDTPSGTTRAVYLFAGQVILQREMVPDGKGGYGENLSYLHGDHLGSVSAATSSTGTLVSSQSYDPWGKVRSGGGSVIQTRLNYTGQKLDDTGLLYYHARYYDSGLARFTSPDTIVPGASSGVGGAGGTVGQEQNSRLTVDFHESGFVSSLIGENQQVLHKGFWFQLSGDDKQNAKEPWGPGNPQALNRYSYVLNNPLRYVDPSGHLLRLTHAKAKELLVLLRDHVIPELRESQNKQNALLALGAILATMLSAGFAEVAGALAAVVGGGAADLAALGTGLSDPLKIGAAIDMLEWMQHQLEDFDREPEADYIDLWFSGNGKGNHYINAYIQGESSRVSALRTDHQVDNSLHDYFFEVIGGRNRKRPQ